MTTTNTLPIRVINTSGNPLPQYETEGAAGMDLMCKEAFDIWPGDTKRIDTGLSVEIPPGYELQVRSRSGLALRKGLIVLNSPGTIDSDYRGEIGVILHLARNYGESYHFEKGARIAQAVLCPIMRATWVEVDELEKTLRKNDGFGSTGVYTV